MLSFLFFVGSEIPLGTFDWQLENDNPLVHESILNLLVHFFDISESDEKLKSSKLFWLVGGFYAHLLVVRCYYFTSSHQQLLSNENAP